MRRIQPLPESHPQLSVARCQSYHEFKVENWRLASDGSGKKVQPCSELKVAIGVAVLAWWFHHFVGLTLYLGIVTGLWLLMQEALLVVTHETLIVYPEHGIQMETHRGFNGFLLSSSRTFIPFTTIRDVVINEALYGWNVRYYIVVITQPRSGAQVLKVAFPNLLPHFPILKSVCTEIQMYLPSNQKTSNGTQ